MEDLLLPENLTFSIEIVLGTINMTFPIYDGSRVRSGRSRDRLHYYFTTQYCSRKEE